MNWSTLNCTFFQHMNICSIKHIYNTGFQWHTTYRSHTGTPDVLNSLISCNCKWLSVPVYKVIYKIKSVMVIINGKKPKQFLTLTKNGCCYILTSHGQLIYMSVHISGSESIEFIMMINSSCHYQNIASSSLCFVTTIFYCIIITIFNNTLFIAHRLSRLYCLYDHYMYSKLLILKCFNAILKFLTKN